MTRWFSARSSSVVFGTTGPLAPRPTAARVGVGVDPRGERRDDGGRATLREVLVVRVVVDVVGVPHHVHGAGGAVGELRAATSIAACASG